MRRFGVTLLLLVAAAPAAARHVPVHDALCVSVSAGPLLGASAVAREAYLGALDDLGWRGLRTDFTWTALEPARGAFAFADYDDLVSRASAHGIGVLGILDYGNPWAAPQAPAGDDHYPPADPADFAAFAGAAARHFAGRVAAWELWNEENNPTFWKPAPDPGTYARLALLAARAIHAAGARVPVATGGLAPTFDFLAYHQDWGFLAAAAAAHRGWLRGFDAAAVHPYTFLQTPAPEFDTNAIGPSVPHQLADFRARLAAAGGGRLPVWVTEMGWYTAPDSGTPLFPPGVSEDDQARYLVRGTALALAAGAERVCWYTLTDFANFLHDKEAAFGLLRWNPDPAPGALVPKPAYTAARTFAAILGDTRFGRDLSARLGVEAAGGYALAFRGRARTVLLLWAPGAAVPLRLTPSGRVRAARVIAQDGTVTALDARAPITLTLGPSPVYLELEEGDA
ncbi:MAG TPA: hypothetical protein VKW76_05610 [Candidatus Binatia bacterium]|nr:hypothetical protein [Candidatus Binatia bacterium]